MKAAKVKSKIALRRVYASKLAFNKTVIEDGKLYAVIAVIIKLFVKSSQSSVAKPSPCCVLVQV